MTDAAQFHLLRRYENSREKLRAAVQSDPAVRAEAEDELSKVIYFTAGNRGDGRCVMSKGYADLLIEALADAP